MDIKELVQLIGVLKETGYEHIDLTREGTHLILNKTSLQVSASVAPIQAMSAPAVQSSVQQVASVSEESVATTSVSAVSNVVESLEVEDDTNTKAIESPIVGTFYDSPDPEADAYVKVGDIVKKGDIVCIIEAMKLMNEIEAEESGEIIEILVKNEDPVEYGQKLYKLK